MPKKKYLVTLDDAEREQLEHLLHRGTHATRKVTRARILLKAAAGWEDPLATRIESSELERARQFTRALLQLLRQHPPQTRRRK